MRRKGACTHLHMMCKYKVSKVSGPRRRKVDWTHTARSTHSLNTESGVQREVWYIYLPADMKVASSGQLPAITRTKAEQVDAYFGRPAISGGPPNRPAPGAGIEHELARVGNLGSEVHLVEDGVPEPVGSRLARRLDSEQRGVHPNKNGGR